MAAKMIEELSAIGCDTDSAMDRFLKNEGMYIRFLVKFLDDVSFGEIKPYIDAENYEAALKSTHTLKGVGGNLGLTAVYEISADMVNNYRAGLPELAVARYGELQAAYDAVCDIINRNK